MALFTREMFEPDEDEAGIHLCGLSSALVTWVGMQDRGKVTVAEATMAFNTTPEVVREAVCDGSWMFLFGADSDPLQTIELDGE